MTIGFLHSSLQNVCSRSGAGCLKIHGLFLKQKKSRRERVFRISVFWKVRASQVATQTLGKSETDTPAGAISEGSQQGGLPGGAVTFGKLV